MKGSAVWLLFIIHVATTTGSKPNNLKTGVGRNDHLIKPENTETELARERQPGAHDVEIALSHLQRTPRTPPRYQQTSTGLVGKVVRYVFGSIFKGPTRGPEKARKSQAVSASLLEAVSYLEKAAKQNNADALYILAELNFFGYHNHPRDLSIAFRYFEELASKHGNATAQHMLGVYYSTGLGKVVEQDQATALLYYSFAAIRGDVRSEMATGFRYQTGIGTIKSCDSALKYYKSVADKAIEWHRSGPPGGRAWVHEAWWIADEAGGVYGEGASASSSGLNAYRTSAHADANPAITDIIEYMDVISQKGDSKASFNLGRMYYEGQRGLDKNFEAARKYFLLVASRNWKKDLRIVEGGKQGVDKTAVKVAGYIGRMYLRGEGFAQNFEKAKAWFDRGKAYGDAQSQYGLGLMLLNGYGIKQNISLAIELLRASAEQDYAPANVEMGRLHLDQGGEEEVRTANNHFELAARWGNIEAHYYLAEMSFHGVGRDKICGTAVNYYKNVAEKAEPLVSSWAEANGAYEYGDYDLAFLHFLLAAEQGYERAQTNVAYMLDSERDGKSMISLFREHRPTSELLTNPKLALVYWTRSSRQSNVDSLVKMGDYYYHGIGAEPDMKRAVQCYTGASDFSQSAQAMFNLGWMHENGVGLKQDFHLAKRYYDNALQINTEAYLPVTLSLIKLRIRSAWNTLTHGPIHSIEDEPNNKKDWSFSEWIANFLEDNNQRFYEEELYDDMFDDTVGLGDDVDGDDGLLESVLIIGVTMSLMFLLWWRQRLQANNQANEAARRDQEQQGAQNNQAQEVRDGFAGWAAGGFGI